MNTKKQILVVGSSRGIGAEIVKYFSNLGHEVFGVSRSQSHSCEWIEADISTSEGIAHVINKIGQKPIDSLLFTGGTWEEYGFMIDFDFLKTSGILVIKEHFVSLFVKNRNKNTFCYVLY
ncbi:hypothetical protein DZA31_00040 [Arcobacter sp. HD9-500m-PIT-SAG02]|nr:hypothetical protein DZA31_00040 [Arcobacter sp. HD9-500m-PIT-SAG02]